MRVRGGPPEQASGATLQNLAQPGLMTPRRVVVRSSVFSSGTFNFGARQVQHPKKPKFSRHPTPKTLKFRVWGLQLQIPRL